MTDRVETIDVSAGMAAAVVAPALAGAIIGLAGGPGFALAVFLFASGIALAHVTLLALPLYGLLRLLGRQPGPGTVLVSAAAIGALPGALLVNMGVGAVGGLFGLIGGGAFCAMSVVRDRPDG